MGRTKEFAVLRQVIGIVGFAAMGLIATEALSGCIVAGYSARGGFFVWPGSIVVTLVLLLIFFLLHRGR